MHVVLSVGVILLIEFLVKTFVNILFGFALDTEWASFIMFYFD